ARLADVHHDVGQRAAAPRPVPVLLIRFDSYRIPETDPLGGGTPRLNPSGPIDDVQELTPFMRVPVTASARLEANDQGCGREWRPSRRQQLARTRPTREVSGTHGVEVA